MFPDEEKTVKRGKDYMLADSVVTRWGAEHVRTEMKQLRKGEARRKEAEKELRRLKKDGLIKDTRPCITECMPSMEQIDDDDGEAGQKGHANWAVFARLTPREPYVIALIYMG